MSHAHRSGHHGRPHRSLRAIVATVAALLCGGVAQAQNLIDPFLGRGVLPRPIMPAPDDLIAITAGMNHTCVLRFDGGVLCWGDNGSGQTGVPSSPACKTVDCVTQPTRVATDANGQPFRATSISAGLRHTCALDAGGNALCWGLNSDGQIGVPSLLRVERPTPAAPGQTFTGIGAGMLATCASEPAATWCWGAAGRITGSGMNSYLPQPVPVSANHLTPSTGHDYLCLHSSHWGWNEVNCIGVNASGQTTHDPAVEKVLPVVMGSDFGRPAGPPSTRTSFTCADRRSDGTVACAGSNAHGNLGDGSNKDSFRPVSVGGGQRLAGVSAGWMHACAVDPQQRAWCWGSNGAGQLGNYTARASGLPVLVGKGVVTFRAVAAGFRHTCGIGTDNRVYCWGENTHGQLGVGDSTGWTDRPLDTVPLPRE